MKYLFLIILLPLSACSPVQPINIDIPHKTIETHPNIYAQGATARISISRKESYFASATYYWISLNSITIMALRSGDYTSFMVKPGKYRLAVDCYGDDAWHSNAVEVVIQSDDSLYFEVEPALSEYCDISAINNEAFLKAYKIPKHVDFGITPDPDR